MILTHNSRKMTKGKANKMITYLLNFDNDITDDIIETYKVSRKDLQIINAKFEKLSRKLMEEWNKIT